MDSLESRIDQARSLWQQGESAENDGDLPRAYKLYTQAHDLIMDCAVFHRQAHEKLIRINSKLGHYGEWVTDWLLLRIFSYLGVFQLVSYVQNKASFFSRLCQHGTGVPK